MTKSSNERQATILFADMIDSSALSHMLEPKMYNSIVCDFHLKAKEIVEELKANFLNSLPEGTHVEAGIRGDEFSFMLVSPPVKSYLQREPFADDFGLRSTTAALQLAIRLKRRWLLVNANKLRIEKGQPPLGIAVGIHSGPVILGEHWRFPAGHLSTPLKAITAEGYAINLAKRVETASRIGRWSKIFLTRPIYNSTPADFRQAFIQVESPPLQGIPSAPIIYEAKGIGHFDNKSFPQDADFRHKGNLELYERIVSLDPSQLWLLLDLAHKYFDSGDYEKAITKYKAVLEVDPGFAPAYAYLGRAFFRNYYFPEAQAALEQATTINPNYSRAWNFLAVCLRRLALFVYYKADNQERARNLLERSLHCHDKAIRFCELEGMCFPWGHNALYNTIAECYNYKPEISTPWRLSEAYHESEKLLKHHDVISEQKQHLIHHTMGVIQLKLNDSRLANRHLTLAQKSLKARYSIHTVDIKGYAERLSEILYHKGMCEMIAGRFEMAKNNWKEGKDAIKEAWGKDWERAWDGQYWKYRRVSFGSDVKHSIESLI
jgi:tetratricopeptide (TPR) repeat protein